MIALNKTIAFIKNWKHAFIVALLLGILLPLLLILLEPFDTNQASFKFKTLKLAGYALCIIFPILIIHPIEIYLYKKQHNRWFVLNEAIYILVLLFIMYACAFLYHFLVIGVKNTLRVDDMWSFMIHFGLPFAPILIPFWLYFRSKFGIIEVLQTRKNQSIDKIITIKSANKSENFSINESDFVYAQAQQNYVVINFRQGNVLNQKMIRSTLSNLMKQLPSAWQVHRSYLVNLDYFESVQGNSRKRTMSIDNISTPIPISQKYYSALKDRLTNSSQKLQN